MTPKQKSQAVAEIIATLPEWFGIPASNQRYIRDVGEKDAFAAYAETSQLAGLMAATFS